MKSLDWDIIQMPILVAGNFAKKYKAICRNDNGMVLNIPKKSYEPTTNQVFMETSERLCEITGFQHCGYEEFKEGRKVLVFLKNPDKLKVCDWDCDDYMLLGNSHDGTTTFFVGTTNVMVRCQNQFSFVNQRNKVYHKANSSQKVNDLLRYFEAYKANKNRMVESMEKMQTIKISESIRSSMISRVLNMSQEEVLGNLENLSTRKVNLLHSLEKSIITETSELGNNVFGLFNGITHWTTHQREVEKTFGNCLGSNAVINKKAWELATTY